MLEENRRSQIALLDPTTDAERAACAAQARLAMPTVVDRLDNAVASVYGGWPDRLYLVGGDGRIAYQGGEGPFGFEPAALAAAIERELA